MLHLQHEWSWPRRRAGCDVQTCVECGAERIASIQFAGSLATDEPKREQMEEVADVTA